jgi:hypothetical protein
MHSPLIEHHWDESVAAKNKALIAAAPELLEALEDMIYLSSKWGREWFNDEQWAMIEKANQVIKKARGL